MSESMARPTRTFASRSLKHVIPTVYTLASDSSIVHILAPWVNVETVYNMPYIGSEAGEGMEKTLIELMVEARETRGVDTRVYMRNKIDNPNPRTIDILEENDFKYHIYNKLHTKAIVSDRLVIEGSANISKNAMNELDDTSSMKVCDSTPESYLSKYLDGMI